MWGGIPTPHEPCSYCYSPYHHVKDCPTAGQFSNYSYEHMNTQFFGPRNEPYCDSYDPAWSNQSNIPWQAQAPESYAPQFYELYHQTYPQLNDQAAYPSSNFHPPLQHWQSSPYCANFEDNWQPSSQATPPPRFDSDLQDQLLKFMNDIATSVSQTWNSRFESIAKIDVGEEEPSPIDWSPQQQYHAEPPSTQSGSDFQIQMLKLMGEINQDLKSQGQAIAKLEAQREQMIKQIEEEELQRQSVVNLDGHYVVDENTYHEQAITTMNNGEVVDTHGEERKEEQIEAP